MPALLLKGGTVAEFSPSRLERLDVRVVDGRIAELGPELAPGEQDQVLDVTGKLVMPGMVCAHTHLYSALSRGMPPSAHPPANFLEILEHVWWRLDQCLDEEILYASALVGAVEALQAGTTTLIDHHASPGFVRGSLEIIAQALEDVGLRGILAYEVTDRRGMPERDEGLDEHVAFLGQRRELVRGMVGGHAPFTLGKASLEGMGRIMAATGVGSHVHVAEDRFDVEEAHRLHGMSPIRRMYEAGCLDARSIVGHAVHCGGQDLDLIREAGAMLVHNPRSNMNNAVGYARLALGEPRVALGTDGIGADMFAEAQAAFYQMQEAKLGLGAEGIARMLETGAAFAADYFELPIGHVVPGAAADLMVLDYRSPTPLTPGNLPWHFIFGMSSRLVDTVLVAGHPVLVGGRFPHLDLDRVYGLAQAAAVKMWERMAQTPPLLHAVAPR